MLGTVKRKVSHTSLFSSQFMDCQCLCLRVNRLRLISIKFEVLPKVLIFLYSMKSLSVESSLHLYPFTS